jgi:hypothetical protein
VRGFPSHHFGLVVPLDLTSSIRVLCPVAGRKIPGVTPPGSPSQQTPRLSPHDPNNR